MVKVTDDKGVRSKRKLRSPLKEILMEEDMGKKQKIDREVLVLSKLMAQQLGLAVATGQPSREQWVLYAETVRGLGTLAQLKLSKKWFWRKIPSCSFLLRPSL